MLVESSVLSFVVSFVKIIIERSFVPQVPFEKFSRVGRGERPENAKRDNNWLKLKKNYVYIQQTALPLIANATGFVAPTYDLQR